MSLFMTLIPAVNSVLGAAGPKMGTLFRKIILLVKIKRHKNSFSIWFSAVDKRFHFNGCYIHGHLHVTKPTFILFFTLYLIPFLK